MHLTKSDFKTARDCPAKLYYKKHRYPSTAKENLYLEYLADAGFVVEKIAQLLYPDGTELDFALDSPEAAAEATREWLSVTERGTLFEAVVVWREFMARVDILHVEDGRLDLVEVKSASVDGAEDDPLHTRSGEVVSGRRAYVEDVLYQAELVSRAFPDYRVRPFLCLVDKSRRANENWTLERFTLRAPTPGDPTGRPTVTFDGDPEQLRKDNPLVLYDLTEDRHRLGGELWRDAERFAASLSFEEIRRLPGPLGPAPTPERHR